MAGHHKITIFANGKAHQVDGTMTIGEFVDHCQLSRKMVMVEHNGTALLRDEWPNRSLSHGDRLEIIKVVAGG